jgi:manganese transport protein
MFAGVSFQQGGIIGGMAQVLNIAFPFFSAQAWTFFVAVLAILALLRGFYSHIERTCTVLVSTFTFVTITCAVMLFWTSYSLTWENLKEGFAFSLPSGGLAIAFAVFGITGVGATELVYYPYWCLEKGYARSVGRKDGSSAWLKRARGWIHVMQVDSLFAMAVYTLATVAFYLLGAAVLYGGQKIPEGYEMVRTLSNIYTVTLGNWALALFLIGAFFVLFSTTFSATASASRVLVDFFNLVGLVELRDKKSRLVVWRRVVVCLITLYAFWFLIFGVPVQMVIVGGIAQACMLPILGFSSLLKRSRQTSRSTSVHKQA